jgi:DNA-binding transcriptional LysR family regulator
VRDSSRLDFRLLDVFCAVFEERSFSLAARRLGLAQPTVSAHIQSLERSLAARLFDRTARRVEPTRAGEVLYDAIRPLAEMRRAAVERLSRFLGKLEGELRLGASTIPGEYLLPPRIASFRLAHPGVRIRLLIRDSRAVLDELLARRIEVGFVGARLGDGKLRFTPFGKDRLVLIAPPGFPAAKRKGLAFEELKRHPFVLREPGSGTRHAFEQALVRAGHRIDELDIVAELGSAAAVKEAVRAGVGLAVVSELAVSCEIANGQLAKVQLRGLDPLVREFFMVLRAGCTLSPLAEAFLERIGLKA